ncbi:YraN family protein [Helicobacter cholecystus]|uniref:UPF0102 protein CQA62_03605 n=1 Tax=Helicobacter cholecystus TaxID=45498 RepID=A0A3D8IVF3_9HELI|nr:YraN family protein [Helicobacter cholecystus]RDU69238.1 YraN family protein [Helicobacter cholecystus]VEJ24313.1 endonuclease like protein [Helicobacter cholecystus]
MSREWGNYYEEKGCEFLKDNGFEIIERNFYSRFGEIDIIALKDKVLHFIEVKGSARRNPVYAITSKKLHKINQTIGFYFYQNDVRFDYCIDALIICGDEVTLLENITI